MAAKMETKPKKANKAKKQKRKSHKEKGKIVVTTTTDVLTTTTTPRNEDDDDNAEEETAKQINVSSSDKGGSRRRKMSIEEEDAEIDDEHEHRLMENAECSSAEEEDHQLVTRSTADDAKDETDDQSPSATSEEEGDDEEGDDDDDEEKNANEQSDDDDDDDDDDEDNNKKEDQNETTEETKESVPVPLFESDGRYHNKQRCLVVSSRGVTARYRHLLEDLRTLIPHHKKDAKIDGPSKGQAGGLGAAVNEIAEMKSCNTVLFLECRAKRSDCYMWISSTSSTPNGPSAKFLLTNVHTMDELRLTGNALKGSRPILSFDESFDKLVELRLLKVLFQGVFGTPRGHPKSKPFVDRIMAFYYADNKIWVRNYQILEEQASNAKEASKQKHDGGLKTSLVEIGPRFVLTLEKIFTGSFGGQTLYQNSHFVSPHVMRMERAKQRSQVYNSRKLSEKKRKERQETMEVPTDPLDSVFR